MCWLTVIDHNTLWRLSGSSPTVPARRIWGESMRINLGFLLLVAAFGLVACAPPPTTPPVNDVTAPTIVSVTATPSTVTPGQTFTVSARVTDTTGVTYVGLQSDLNGTQATWCGYTAALTSGTATDGIWTVTCTVPNIVNSGAYSVFPYAQDALGNWANINNGPSTPLRGNFTVA